MCGIIGLLANGKATDRQIKLVHNLLWIDQQRGEHATGLAKVDVVSGESHILKRAMSASEFLLEEDTIDFLVKDRQKLYIGHNRFATMGKRDDTGAHPFKHEHITMVHNGTVDSWTQKDLSGYDKDHVTVDSEMVCHTIAELGIEEAVKKFSGAFSLVWWDSKERTLNFLRNEKRPMWIMHLEDCMMWASEKDFMEVFINRDRMAKVVTKPYQTAVNTLYSWKFNAHGWIENKGLPETKELKFANIPDPEPAFFPRYQGGGSPNAYYDDRSNRPKNRITASIRAADGTSLGNAENVARINRLLNANGMHDLKAGDRITFDLAGFTPYTTGTVKGDLSGNIVGSFLNKKKDLVTIRAFNIRKSDITNSKGEQMSRLVGTIENAYQSTSWQNGVKTEGFQLTVENVMQSVTDPDHSFQLEDKEEPKEKKSATGVSFPLKVDGYQFDNYLEFMEFTSEGCACCGDIPNVFDNRNKRMVVYKLAQMEVSDLDQAEFICGACIVEDEQKAKLGNKK